MVSPARRSLLLSPFNTKSQRTLASPFNPLRHHENVNRHSLTVSVYERLGQGGWVWEVGPASQFKLSL
jgi:hypothetical protein